MFRAYPILLPRLQSNLPQIAFEILAECPTTRARAGLLHTPHGTIETPVFMPVGTQATVKGLSQRDLAEDLGVKILLANTYHLFLRPGPETIRGLGGLHRFMSWPNAILTDSGGYQVFSLSGLRKISDHGVVFQSHLDGSLHTFTPRAPRWAECSSERTSRDWPLLSSSKAQSSWQKVMNRSGCARS